MPDILNGERITNVVHDGGGVMECYTEDGQRLIINGYFTKYCIEGTSNGYLPWGIFTGTLEVSGVLATVEVHYKGDSGVINIVTIDEHTPSFTLTRYNPSFAVLALPDGREYVLIRNLDLPWEPEKGYLAGYVGDQKILFIIQ